MLSFISVEGFPNYIALSSDIVDNHITGASLVGKTVFLLDTYEWMIINADLSLSEITGTRNTILLDNLYATLQVTSTQYAQVMADEFHFKVHNDLLWTFSYLGTGWASGAVLNIGITTGIKDLHIAMEFSSTANAQAEIYYGSAAFSGGSAIACQNHNYNIATSPLTSVVLNPTITGAGTSRQQFLVAGGSGGNATGGTISYPFNREIRIPANSKFYVKCTNLDGNGSAINVLGDFYEISP